LWPGLAEHTGVRSDPEVGMKFALWRLTQQIGCAETLNTKKSGAADKKSIDILKKRFIYEIENRMNFRNEKENNEEIIRRRR